jgi:hypothetical protein
MFVSMDGMGVHVCNSMLLRLSILHVLETVANNITMSINALTAYNIIGNHTKTENVTIPGNLLCRTMIRL